MKFSLIMAYNDVLDTLFCRKSSFWFAFFIYLDFIYCSAFIVSFRLLLHRLKTPSLINFFQWNSFVLIQLQYDYRRCSLFNNIVSNPLLPRNQSRPKFLIERLFTEYGRLISSIFFAFSTPHGSIKTCTLESNRLWLPEILDWAELYSRPHVRSESSHVLTIDSFPLNIFPSDIWTRKCRSKCCLLDIKN